MRLVHVDKNRDMWNMCHPKDFCGILKSAQKFNSGEIANNWRPKPSKKLSPIYVVATLDRA